MVAAYPGKSQRVARRIRRIAGSGTRKVGKSGNLQRDGGKHACTTADLVWEEGKAEEGKMIQTQYMRLKERC